jgi:hypothetical protein
VVVQQQPRQMPTLRRLWSKGYGDSQNQADRFPYPSSR